ncbi:MAG: rRNA maturation RNase YbeY [Ignavibacteriae bacterium]|nr:rRNA maturation RNase YbeY [Ignavibacteriota bacterium]
MKNLTVQNSKEYKIDKKEIHKIVSFLKNELLFDINEMSINIVTSEEIHKVNKQFLNHDYSTDIITFNYSEEKNTLETEIFISLDDAYSNAVKYKVSLDNELLRLVIHGCLHLLGYDDKDKNDKAKMKRMENKLVNKFENLVHKIVKDYDGKNC